MSSQMDTIDGAHVLIQFFKEEDSHALFVLQQEGLTALTLKQYVSHGGDTGGKIVKRRGDRAFDDDGQDELEDGEGSSATDPLEAYTTDLNAEAEAGHPRAATFARRRRQCACTTAAGQLATSRRRRT